MDLTNFRLKEDKIAELEKSQEAFKDVEILEKRIVESMQRLQEEEDEKTQEPTSTQKIMNPISYGGPINSTSKLSEPL